MDNQKLFHFLNSHLTCACALSSQTNQHKNSIFLFNCCTNTHSSIIKLTTSFTRPVPIADVRSVAYAQTHDRLFLHCPWYCYHIATVSKVFKYFLDMYKWLLSRVIILTRYIDIAILSVRPSRSGIPWKRLNILS